MTISYNANDLYAALIAVRAERDEARAERDALRQQLAAVEAARTRRGAVGETEGAAVSENRSECGLTYTHPSHVMDNGKGCDGWVYSHLGHQACECDDECRCGRTAEKPVDYEEILKGWRPLSERCPEHFGKERSRG